MQLFTLAPILLTAFVIAMLTEAAIIIWRKRQSYDWRESVASLGVALGQRAISAALGGAAFAALLLVWEFRWFTISFANWYEYFLLFIGVEFAYYWHHRCSHEVRWFWATHCVHHSPQQMYLSGAVRVGWTSQVSGAFLFYAPLVLVGLHPAAVVAALALNLLYQFWLHTELIGRIPGFDLLFNSPSNHRVHHAVNVEYLDCNYGGITMIFDHCFATFRREQAGVPIRYGLIRRIDSHNPFRIAFDEWVHMMCDAYHARSVRAALGYLFAPPGWAPDGTGRTSRSLRSESADATQTRALFLRR